MGRLKHMMEQGYNSDLGASICPDCISEDGIKAFIIENSNVAPSTCSYCNTTNLKTCDMGIVIGYIYGCIIKEWSDPAEELPYETAEGGYQGEVLHTSELLWELGVDVEYESIHDDIVNSIEQGYWTKTNYFSLARDQTFTYGWRNFCQFVISTSRYFFLDTQNESYDANQHDEMNPIEILDLVASIIKNLNMLKKIPTSQEIKRVRIVDDYNEATTASHLGSPPLEYCKMANRMSPAGIPMFYGAFDIETSIKETYEPEPHLTKKAVAGNFYPC
ncbi:HEPN-associated N-terminal domain-containing protein, partial [Pseudoalteromonas sp. Z1A6]|uniref:HEPN-associated N-terminal domain-containing protein n=1 Tax=Pseudoalteromonas sp. Z1A6 TaxID=2686349 RepID=UPI0013FD1612